ncbi:hypothetical protein BB559_000177 [Furculomyces boomerangus]|uniref:Cytochrome c oxidase assembly protein COX20, mitochondrial n=2 Tax=Harpellales TaxID=61421 RepID=A0A2T9Z664_9FUNG|nr:hypothetical protein BB559_000177 [Furculomyces boomerangus]PVZ97933.1 hypothetical protein BB558_006096 [Smittium angustum]PWA01828.1 hypothetical protein BB558_002069 [Smittium angustum]
MTKEINIDQVEESNALDFNKTAIEARKNKSSSTTETKPNIVEAIKTQSWNDFKSSPKLPCSREGLMYGIGLGLSTGLLRFVQKGKIRSAGNWAVGGFVGFSIVAREGCLFLKRHQHMKVRDVFEKSAVLEEQKKKKLRESGKIELENNEKK